MITKEIIHNILNVKETYQTHLKIMELILDKKKREEMFDKFLQKESDLSYDWFTNYFQENQSDRKDFMQDFTPDCVCEIVTKISENGTNNIADICAGTGSLTIKLLNKYQEATYHCEELSNVALAFLLFNLAIRNINAIIEHKNVLTNAIQTRYKLTKGDKYSDIDIEKVEQENETDKFDCVVMNPPYSLKWEQLQDERFTFGIAPKTKADYAFIQHGFFKTKETGTLIVIVPHGVLFRTQKEYEIRKAMIENNVVDTIIGLPDKLFLNTSIPVCIIVFKRNRKNNNILFIDASKEFKKGKKQNEMTQEHINKIVDTYNKRAEVEKYSHVADLNEIKENDYNLNISRYVDTFEEEPIPDLVATMMSLIEIDNKIRKTSIELVTMMNEMKGFTKEEAESIKAWNRYIKGEQNGINET